MSSSHIMSTSALRRSFQQLATTWPKDVLRPTIQFGAAIHKASERVFFEAVPAASAEPASPAPTPAAPRKEIELSPVQLGKAQETVDSLQRLLSSQALNSVRRVVSYLAAPLTCRARTVPYESTHTEPTELPQALSADEGGDPESRARGGRQTTELE